MFQGKKILAIVPARSGSKGIPDKNMALLGGQSLIARAGRVLQSIPWIDRRIISTDSERYVEEARRSGLEAPFLRPVNLSTDTAGAYAVILHALESCEIMDRCVYEMVLVAEPTSPLREVHDVETTVRALLDQKADSAFTVSPIDTKCHPHKLFRVVDGWAQFYADAGKAVTNRQELEGLYSRNGLCYCIRRDTLLVKKAIITERSVPIITKRLVANIDEPLDLLWAEFLLKQLGQSTGLIGERH